MYDVDDDEYSVRKQIDFSYATRRWDECDGFQPSSQTIASGLKYTGVNLSKILMTLKNWGERVSITDDYMGVSQLFGSVNKVYAYGYIDSNSRSSGYKA